MRAGEGEAFTGMPASSIDWAGDGGKASLYVHIPFCRAACSYCDFFSVPDPAAGIMESYLDALAAEFECIASWLEGAAGFSGWKSVYIGGGTPSLLPRAAFASFLKTLRSAAIGPLLEEWTVECNPESLDEELLRILDGAGVDRISLGVQSLEDAALRRACRPCDAEKAREAIELISRSWKGTASADLMLGLPGQTERGLLSDIREVADAGFRHVSLYCLSVEEGTPFAGQRRERPGDFLSDDAEADLWELAKSELAVHGLHRYEVSNFSFPGRESVHNRAYWRMEPYIGIGCAAVSTLPVQGGFSIRRENGTDIGAYVNSGGRGSALLSEIGRTDAMKETLLMGFRTVEGIDLTRFRRRFRVELADALGGRYARSIERGTLLIEDGRARLAEKSIDTLDPFLLECFRELDRRPDGADLLSRST